MVVSCKAVGQSDAGICGAAGVDLAGMVVPHISPNISPLANRAANTEGGISAGMVSPELRCGIDATLIVDIGERSIRDSSLCCGGVGYTELNPDICGVEDCRREAVLRRRFRCDSLFWIRFRSAGSSTPYQQSDGDDVSNLVQAIINAVTNKLDTNTPSNYAVVTNALRGWSHWS